MPCCTELHALWNAQRIRHTRARSYHETSSLFATQSDTLNNRCWLSNTIDMGGCFEYCTLHANRYRAVTHTNNCQLPGIYGLRVPVRTLELLYCAAGTYALCTPNNNGRTQKSVRVVAATTKSHHAIDATPPPPSHKPASSQCFVRAQHRYIAAVAVALRQAATNQRTKKIGPHAHQNVADFCSSHSKAAFANKLRHT